MIDTLNGESQHDRSPLMLRCAADVLSADAAERRSMVTDTVVWLAHLLVLVALREQTIQRRMQVDVGGAHRSPHKSARALAGCH